MRHELIPTPVIEYDPFNEDEKEDEEESILLLSSPSNVKESIDNIILKKNDELEKDDVLTISPPPPPPSYQHGDDDDDDDDNNFKIDVMTLVCICLIILLALRVIYLSVYNSPLIKYIFITLFFLTLIYPTITDFIYYNMFLVQNFSYFSVKKFGIHMRDLVKII